MQEHKHERQFITHRFVSSEIKVIEDVKPYVNTKDSSSQSKSLIQAHSEVKMNKMKNYLYILACFTVTLST